LIEQEQHLAAERKRRTTLVLSVVIFAWYLVYLLKPIAAERPDVQLAFVLIAVVAVPISLYRKGVQHAEGIIEARLPIAELYELLFSAFESSAGPHKFDVAICREPDFLSCRVTIAAPNCRGTLAIELVELAEEFTRLNWSLRFDRRVAFNDARYIEDSVKDWLAKALYGWVG
jgi:hypothetical protein